MTDLQAAWVFDVLVFVVVSVLDVVLQAFALHSALARARVHRPELAGMGLLSWWAPAIAAWLFVSIEVGLRRASASCSSADLAFFAAGVLYPLTALPAWFLARRAKAPLGAWYPVVQLVIAALLALGGGIPCWV